MVRPGPSVLKDHDFESPMPNNLNDREQRGVITKLASKKRKFGKMEADDVLNGGPNEQEGKDPWQLID